MKRGLLEKNEIFFCTYFKGEELAWVKDSYNKVSESSIENVGLGLVFDLMTFITGILYLLGNFLSEL